MTPTTKEQRRAIAKLWHRHRPLASGRIAQDIVREAGWRFQYDEAPGVSYWWHPNVRRKFNDAHDIVLTYGLDREQSYMSFRRTVSRGYDCLMVNIAGMWVGIEPDGYTHT